MHELLPFYERELVLLQQQAEEFARRHPRIAGRLSSSGELLQDPQVQRLVQSFALLAARIHARLEDDVPEFTRPLLQRLCPQWLRPLPACAIARFDDAGSQSATRVLPAGTALQDARPGGTGTDCRWRTTAPVQLLPLRVAWAGFSAAVDVPPGTPMPRDATALLSLRLELIPEAARWDALGVDHLRLFLDAEPVLATLLREALTGRVAATLVQVDDAGPWRIYPDARPQAVGLADGESVLGPDPGWPPAQALLADWFAFPDRFDFVDLPLPTAARRAPGRTLGLHFALAGPPGDGQRLLSQVQAHHFVPGCTPVVNLYDATAKAQAEDGQPGVYGVTATEGQKLHEVHAVTRVTGTCKAGGVEVTLPLGPWGLSCAAGAAPEDWPAEAAALLPPGGLYWTTRRRRDADGQPGLGALELVLVDVAGRPVAVPGAEITLEVRATDGARPAREPWGQAGGDLSAEGSKGGRIRILRAPTLPRQPVLDAAKVWRVVSLLSLKPLALDGAGLDALKDSLRLLDWTQDPHTEALLQGLVSLGSRPAQGWMVDRDGANLVRGTEVRLAVHEAPFARRGLRLFAHVLSRWFAQCVRADSFTKLVVVSADTGAVLVECPRQTGDVPLI